MRGISVFGATRKLLISEAARRGAKMPPVDSENSAIFQALTGEDISAVERIILTASGGALRDGDARSGRGGI